MYPVVISNGRCTTRDCVIGGYQIPEGVIYYIFYKSHTNSVHLESLINQ